MHWFLYDIDLRHERVKVIAININLHTVYQNHFINDSFLKNRSLQQSDLLSQ